MMVCCLLVVRSTEDTKMYQNLSLTTMIGPIVDKNMRSLSIDNLTNDSEYNCKLLYLMKLRRKLLLAELELTIRRISHPIYELTLYQHPIR